MTYFIWLIALIISNTLTLQPLDNNPRDRNSGGFLRMSTCWQSGPWTCHHPSLSKPQHQKEDAEKPPRNHFHPHHPQSATKIWPCPGASRTHQMVFISYHARTSHVYQYVCGKSFKPLVPNPQLVLVFRFYQKTPLQTTKTAIRPVPIQLTSMRPLETMQMTTLPKFSALNA